MALSAYDAQPTGYTQRAQAASNSYETKDVAEISSIMAASMTFDATMELCRRVHILADRLVGSVPTPVGGTGGNQPSPVAILSALRLTANSVGQLINEAHADLARIESALP